MSALTGALTPHAAPASAPGLCLRSLACARGDRLLFRGLNAKAEAGRLLQVTGANGSGKTSLLRMLCGLLTPLEGEVQWGGRAIAALGEAYRRQLAYLGHRPAAKDELSAIENLQCATALASNRATEAGARAALSEVGLQSHAALPARRLSQGQRQRLALARLLFAAEQPLWVLDEPFNALDRSAQDWLQGLLAAHLQRGGTVVLTSHLPVQLPGGAPTQEVSL